MKKYSCPTCGGKKVVGENIEVSFAKIYMYRQVEKKGLFGRKKFVDELNDEVYRLYDITLKTGGFLDLAGYIRCKSCKWEIKGDSRVQWLSINDIKNNLL